MVPVTVIWAQLFHYDGNLADPLRKGPGKVAAPSKYCESPITQPLNPKVLPEPLEDSKGKPGGIRPCDADLRPFFYKAGHRRSWGTIYNRLTQPGTSQGTISFSPAIGIVPTGDLKCNKPAAPGCLKAPPESLNFDVQLYPSGKLGPGFIGFPIILRVPISERFRLMPPSWFLRFGTGQAGLG